MIYLASILVSLVVGILSGGSVAAIARFQFRLAWLLVLALVLRLTLALAGGPENGWPGWLSAAVNVMSYGLIAGAALANGRPIGMKIAVSGVVLNLLAMFLYGGFMPVDAGRLRLAGATELLAALESGRHPTHTLSGVGIGRFMGDWIAVPWPKLTLISPGDVIISLGLFVLVQQLMRRGISRRSCPSGSMLCLPPLKSID